MSDQEQKLKWKKQNELGFHKNIIQPILEDLKKVVESERDELLQKLNNLKRLGVIDISNKDIQKKLEELKFKS